MNYLIVKDSCIYKFELFNLNRNLNLLYIKIYFDKVKIIILLLNLNC